MIIQGKCSSAVCYAAVIEQEAVDQIRRMCDHEFTAGSRIRIMPDVHAGKGCTIGTTMTVTDKAVPNIVGVDIGCGMYTVRLDQKEIDLPLLDETASRYIPSGRDVWKTRKEAFDLTRLRCYRELRDTPRLERSLGTLGGGNHFIEVERAQDGTLYLVVHTGSRNLGTQVADYYQNLAIRLHKGYDTVLAQRDALIAEYKAAGRRSEIQQALASLVWEEKPLDIPEDLCYLYGSAFEDYLFDVAICQEFAARNRELIASILMERAHLTGGDAFHTIHNYIDTNEMILRKGAIAAHKGEKVLIPVNMRDGSILAVGRGNEEWNFSAPHGAGRLMSRMSARANLSLEEYQRTMRGIYTTSVSRKTLDEAPMAYKSLSDILSVVHESVDVIDIMKPIYNFKAAD